MKKNTKRTLTLLLAVAMLVMVISGCSPKNTTTDDTTTTNPPAGDTSQPSGSDANANTGYPVTPEELGSGTVKWSETDTADGWTEVKNEGGTTLGYSKSSGVKLIQVDGLAFKDLNKNDMLDGYEDWRQDMSVRSADIASQLTAQDIAGLMLYSGHQFAVSSELTEEQTTFLDMGLRAVLSAASGSPTDAQAQWANSMQAYSEGIGLGIPVNFSTDPRDMGVSAWPGNLALAATFDPEIAKNAGKQLSKEFRALGLGTLLGAQIDISSEPRWVRNVGTFGEDPALSRDMTKANTDGYQSTFDASGSDIGWGAESVNAMIKHWPGDGAAQSGRESHDATGAHAVYPGGQFKTHLIPFVDGGFNLEGSTDSATAIMSSYSIAWSEDGSLGELVGSAFSKYKLDLVRSYGFDGVICTDWAVIGGSFMDTGHGVKDLSMGERCYLAITAGVDQFGGLNDPTPVMEAYQLGVTEMGEDAILARFQQSGDRLLRNYFYVGLFDNPYVSVSYAKEVVGSADAQAAAYEAQLKSVVMLKNSDNTIKASSDKPTVYIPMVFTAASQSFFGATPPTASLPIDISVANEYFNVVTDSVSETLTGPAGDDGVPTVAPADIIRATKEELADCDYALVFARNPQNVAGGFMGGGFDPATNTYIPISLQYGPYTANSSSVRSESIAGNIIMQDVQTAYGVQKVEAKENLSYFGKSSKMQNPTDLDMILYAADNMPEDSKVIVAINSTASGAMIFSEFEGKVDAILMGFGVNNKTFLDIASGKVEPSGLLPLQMPANMDTVEANKEDVPRDLDCHVDANGNKYDFAFGLNWAGTISDARTAKYNVPALVDPVATPK